MSESKKMFRFAEGKVYYREQVIAAFYSEAGDPLCGNAAAANSYGRAFAQEMNSAPSKERQELYWGGNELGTSSHNVTSPRLGTLVENKNSPCPSCRGRGANGCNYCNSGGL